VIYSENIELLEELYEKYKNTPEELGEDWQRYFHQIELDGKLPLGIPDSKEAGMQKLLDAYRRQGHRAARIDPLGMRSEFRELIDPVQYNILPEDMDREFDSGIPALGKTKIRNILDWFEKTYCSSIGSEHFYIGNNTERHWLQSRLEENAMQENLEVWIRLRLFEKIFQGETFEKFLARKYVGKKRFSLEGGETLIAVLDTIVEEGGRYDMDGLVIGMAHRGRLNVLVNVLEKPAGVIFAEFDENFTPGKLDYADVKYHLGYSNRKMTRAGKEISLSLMFNPSHLETVNSVVTGAIRARQTLSADSDRTNYMPVIIHGDAAFMGQGVVAEGFNMMGLEGYTVGGTFHIVVNNQIGFTTLPEESRSTVYATDLAKGFQIPIFHVNADDPESVYRIVRLCLEYRQKFHKDVILDLVCYRRLGHNETDEPAFTQPIMYDKIRHMPTTAEVYEKRLLTQPDITKDDIDFIKNGTISGIESSFQRAKDRNIQMQVDTMQGRWSGLSLNPLDSEPETRLLAEQVKRIGAALTSIPADFKPHPKLEKLVEQRKQMFEGKIEIDWGFAEALAFGSILENGYSIRLSGQDSQRGTFSHRHATMVDVNTGKKWTALKSISQNQGRFEVWNSPLSEYSVLGFDYGYSLTDPNTLVLWEAQFGDFANGAQIMIDQFITSSEVKWLRMSGLVMLLPHGYEGQGPEHSSARMERFLQLCAVNNIQVCNCTTPAQYFHLLRRQMLRTYRKPLVVLTPKSLLRHPDATSSMDSLLMGIFREVLYDRRIKNNEEVTRVVFCTGKIFYEAQKARDEQTPGKIAIVRIEQLYPYPESQVQEVFRRYPNAKEFVWLQEEPENMGALRYMEDRIEEQLPSYAKFKTIARPESPSPAEGLMKMHTKQQADLVNKSLSADHFA